MLFAFDFDGALVDSDPYVLLGEQAGVDDEVSGLLDRMWTGNLGFETGLEMLADELSGLPESEVEAAYDGLQLRQGAPDLLASLHEAGHDLAVVTDAPEAAVRRCIDPDELYVDEVVANRLPTENDALAGEMAGPLVGQDKAEALERLATERGVRLDRTAAVGDDLRDLPMLQAAGTGVGVDPEPTVGAEADLAVDSLDGLELRLAERDVL